jgi:hypothetical protein
MESPASNTIRSSEPSCLWVERPKQRGTLEILTFCFTTMLVCVWSAVHLDIPNKRHSFSRRLLTRVFWMVAALFAPELLLYLAINQMVNAYHLETEATKYLRSQPVAGPGMFSRACNYILRREKVDDVSTQYSAFIIIINSLDLAGQ